MDFKKNPDTNFKNVDSLSKEEAQQEVDALREGIEYHDYLYYVKNQPRISDSVYDKLFRRLQELEEAFPELLTDTSPTQRVGSEPVDELKKVKHAEPMLSLNSALEQSDVKDFHEFTRRNTDERNLKYVLEPKFDGFSVEVSYQEGRFQYGVTRGNGKVGEDISKNLKTIRAIPMHLKDEKKIPSFLSVRGEVFMSKKGFQQLNKERIKKGLEPFANPRNAAAGTMRQLDPKNVAGKPLDIFFYEILKVEGNGFASHVKALKQFAKWGLKTDPHLKTTTRFKDIVSYHQSLSNQRDELEYEIDGIVIKVDSFDLRRKLGVRQRSPRWAYAWKFSPKQEITVLEDIVVQIGRTGMLTPVALLQPVDVGGVTVSRASVHNEDEVKRKDVRPGDRVRIARAGDVIPEVVERVGTTGKKRKQPFSMPKKCPSCGAGIYREGAYYFCPAGLSCLPQVIGRIIHYASRDAMDITGLGKKTAQDMVRKGLVKDISELYTLSVEDLLKLDGFAKKSADQLYKAIQEMKNPPLDKFLYALGIRHVGRRVAMLLARRYDKLDNLKKAARGDLEKLEEIGPEIAESVSRFFTEEVNKKVLDRLEKSGVKVKEMPGKKGDTPLKGKTFVFTGKLQNYTREEAQKYVEELGGRASTSVSSQTDYLVAGEGHGSKMEEAKNQGVKIIDEKEFERIAKG